MKLKVGNTVSRLADVAIDGGALQVNIEGTLRFADYFLDGLFADLTVYNRIDTSGERVKETRCQIGKALSRLCAMQKTAIKDEENLRANLKLLVKHEQGVCSDAE